MKNRILCGIKNAAPKIAAVCAMTLFSAGIANAQQPTADVVERLRAMGVSKDMKSLPSWAVPPGTHLSKSIPTNFPVEVYRSNVTYTSFVNSTNGAASAAASIMTRDQPGVVFQFYQSALPRGGWATQVPSAEAMAKIGNQGQFFMIRGTKDIQSVNLTITANKGQPGSVISINWFIDRNANKK